MGVVRGLLRNGWGDVQVVAVETAGAESLHQCVLQKQHVTLPGIRSIAKSLGAVRVCSAAYDLVASPNPPVVVRSMVVLDSDALEALTLFRSCPASAGKMVEPACAASLAVLMRPDLLQERDKTVVVVVCGGNAISDDLLTSYRANCFVP
jgi:L-serine/L-threonine ammonia-lyase